MAEVTVFVDEAVRGWLPDICAKDGVPARGRLRVTEEIGRSNRLGILWLLLLAGPLGWIVLLFVASRSSSEELAVELPYSDTAYERLVHVRRRRTLALAIGALGGIGLLTVSTRAQLGLAGIMLTLGFVGAAMVVVLTADYRLGKASVGVRLDASRRWVTLRGVHPAFAAACDAASELQRQQQTTNR